MKKHDTNSPRLLISIGAFHAAALISHGTPRHRRTSNVLLPTVFDTAMSPSPEREQKKENQNFHPGESSKENNHVPPLSFPIPHLVRN